MLSKRILGFIVVFSTIILLSILSKPDIVSNSMTRIMPDRHHRPSPFYNDHDRNMKPHARHPVTERTFLLMKTGIEVAYRRLPVHFETTFDIFPHHVVYADTNDTIDGMPMIDAISFLDEQTLNGGGLRAYRIRRQVSENRWHWKEERIVIPEDPQGGWNLDRFKNVPAFAHAYLQNPNMDWYVMIDADSYMLASTLQEVTKGEDPNEILYFGKGVGGGAGLFAHGGSGIVLSRGALAAIFGNTQERMDAVMESAGLNAEYNCCGDSVVSSIYEEYTDKLSSDTLQRNEVGQFQGNPISVTHVVLSQWCDSVGSFHALQPWEVSDLYNWEIRNGRKTLLYGDFYNDFILPEIAPVKPNWYADYSNWGIDKRVFNTGDIESHDKDKCIQMCESDPNCMMWEFLGNEACIVFRNSVVRGKAMNPFSTSWNKDWTECTTGYMVDRIKEFRKGQTCVAPSELEEGWLYREHVPGDVHLEQVKLRVGSSAAHE